MPKLPEPDLARIETTPPDHVDMDQPLWRVHNPNHPEHPLSWNHLRHFGPLPTSRFDPWMPPAQVQSPEAIGYFGSTIACCLAEVFQDSRHVTTRHGHQLTAFTPARSLRVFDLRGTWPIQIGASHSLNGGDRGRCRRWAHAIRTVHGDSFDGLIYTGMAGHDSVVLYSPPGEFFPVAPDFTKPMSDFGLKSRLADACEQIGYAFN